MRLLRANHLLRRGYTLFFNGADLANGTLTLDFIGVADEQSLTVDFMVDTYFVWAEDPAWPYGVVGVFQAKGYQ